MSLRGYWPHRACERDLEEEAACPEVSTAVALLAAPRPVGGRLPWPTSLKSRWPALVGLASSDSEAVSSQLARGPVCSPPMPRSQPRSVQGPHCLFIVCGSLFYRPSRFFPPVSLSPTGPVPCTAVRCCNGNKRKWLATWLHLRGSGYTLGGGKKLIPWWWLSF